MADHEETENQEQHQNGGRHRDVDYTFKFLVIGDSGVGKSSMIKRFVGKTFQPEPVSNVGLDLQLTKITRKNTRVALQIWDTAGQERFRAFTLTFFRGALGFILAYDVADERSFLSVRNWVTQIKLNGWDGSQVALVGNKSDLAVRAVSLEEGQALARQLCVPFYETSAKDNHNIQDVFCHLVDAILEQLDAGLEDSLRSMADSFKLVQNTEKTLSKCPC